MTRPQLISQLKALLADEPKEPPRTASRHPVLQEADAIITHIEVNDQHGVGALTRKLFAGCPNILSVRSADYYNGEQDFGDRHFCLSHADKTRDAVFQTTLHALGETTVARILCIPYFADDVRNALAIKEIFGVPLCTYLMDDQNVCADGIPDDLMRELLAKSTLRLAISPELCVVYAAKYGCAMHFMPPLVASELMQKQVQMPPLSPEGVIVGNIWGRRWLDLLRPAVRNTGITLRWYSNGNFRWLNCTREDLIRDAILPHEGAPLPDAQLVEILRNASFVVVPTGILDETDDRRFIARLSLPSRIPYVLATSHAPILVVGDPRTGAARFVEQYGIGTVVPYRQDAFRAAAGRILSPAVNLAMRRNALVAAARFTDIGAAEWIWQSLARGRPIDSRYQDMMPETPPDLADLLAPDTPVCKGRPQNYS